MLKHFTWQHFLVAALVLSCVWYVVLGLIYRDQLKALFKRKPAKADGPLPHAWDEEVEELDEPDSDGLLGKPVLPEGMSRVSMHMFGFAPDVSDERREEQQSLVPDVIEELKNIFHILDKEQGSKEDFIDLFGLVRTKYPAIRGSANQQALNDYIRENVLFPISDEELDNLWV